MNVLAHRNISQMDVKGTVEVNDRPIGREINAISAYIQQEDLFVGSLTVKEHLTFQVGIKGRSGPLGPVGEFTKLVSWQKFGRNADRK